MKPRLKVALLLGIVLLGAAATGAWAQRRRRPPADESEGLPPRWSLPVNHPRDVFTFARLRYSSWEGWGGGWRTDYPFSDFNFSYRLSQLTALQVNPDPVVLDLSDPALFDHPFLYMIEPGRLQFEEHEVETLRRYLLSGGFLMVDDFWGEDEWMNFYTQIKRVFPDREPTELAIGHEIFHIVFNLKEKPQVPSLHHWLRTGQSYERPDAQTPHYRALFDDKGRMMAIICHNTDLGDGWEREGEDVRYFKEFAEPKAYPMGINIVFYAMTH